MKSKSILLAILFVLSVCFLSFAAGVPEGFAPNGKKDRALTVNSVTVDMRNDSAWAQYAPGACKFRAMSTATKAGLQRTLPATNWNIRYIHKSTPFINFSGCTTGELQRY